MSLSSNSIIHTGTATNGHLELNGNAKQCGPASVGVGKEITHASNTEHHSDALCTTPASSYSKQELTLPPVNQGDAPTNNDNHRFFTLDAVSGINGTTGSKSDACWNGVRADGKTTKTCGNRELRVDGNSAVTLGGSIYSFCKLTLRSNSNLYVAPGAKVTIYFDSPEACGYSSGVTQLDLSSNTRITSAKGDAISVAMLFVGSDTRQTKIQLNSNTSVNGPCDQNFIIYAPRSDIDFDSNSHFCGAVAGKSVHLDANVEIWTASGTDDFNLPGVEIPETAAHYTPYRFVECSAVAVEPPDAGC
jgi:hypothetical protein